MSATTDRAAGFAPVARADAKVLILGSLPGQRSIAADQYYAHPRNAFWRIMAELVGADGDYQCRCATLKVSGIALWDVLASSVRPGSMDADIDAATAQANDFRSFFEIQKSVEIICFNGQTAARLFSKKVECALDLGDIGMHTLPSTSPAHAAMSYEVKLQKWRAALTLGD